MDAAAELAAVPVWDGWVAIDETGRVCLREGLPVLITDAEYLKLNGNSGSYSPICLRPSVFLAVKRGASVRSTQLARELHTGLREIEAARTGPRRLRRGMPAVSDDQAPLAFGVPARVRAIVAPRVRAAKAPRIIREPGAPRHYEDKTCACGVRYTPTGSRQLKCAACRRPRGTVLARRYAPRLCACGKSFLPSGPRGPLACPDCR